MSERKSYPDREDLEEILVDMPTTDFEAFQHTLFGIKPEKRPIRMTRGDYKFLNRAYSFALAATLLIGGIGAYKEAIDNYGSLRNTYHAQMENLSRAPWHAVFGP